MIQKAHRMQEKSSADVESSDPIHVVGMVYDLAITACEKQDLVQATKAISALQDALNIGEREAGGVLFRLYQRCLDCLYQGEYEGTALTLRDLREAWAAVEKQRV
jgi:flagellin-specific chaperone FliS